MSGSQPLRGNVSAASLAREVLEVLEVSHEGNLTFPKISVMKNLQKGTETRLEVKSQRMDVGEAEIPDETFTAAYMERQG